MHIEIFQHVPFEGPGVITDWASSRNISTFTRRFFEDAEKHNANSADGVVILGGPMGVHDTQDFPWLHQELALITKTIESNIPILGICLGAQLIAHSLGAKVYKNKEREIGWFDVNFVSRSAASDWLDILPDPFPALHWHGETFDIPTGCENFCESKACAHQGFSGDNILGLQFHLEITPDSVKPLVAACEKEFHSDGRYVQHPEEILKNHARFSEANLRMHRILDQFFSTTN